MSISMAENQKSTTGRSGRGRSRLGVLEPVGNNLLTFDSPNTSQHSYCATDPAPSCLRNRGKNFFHSSFVRPLLCSKSIMASASRQPCLPSLHFNVYQCLECCIIHWWIAVKVRSLCNSSTWRFGIPLVLLFSESTYDGFYVALTQASHHNIHVTRKADLKDVYRCLSKTSLQLPWHA